MTLNGFAFLRGLASVVLALSVGGSAMAQTAPPTVSKRFGQWLFVCQGGNDRGHCALLQTVSETLSRTTVFGWIIRYDGPNLISNFRTPTGIFVNKGIQIKIDDGQPLHIGFERCEARECQALFSITDDFSKQLAAAKQMVVTLALTSGKSADVNLPLDGYAEALAALAATPAAPATPASPGGG
ncbi:MAG TPA: invasion associated locus B family protein [Bauldia sp.]|nr:invasion associated locus B family protein [Bauldia sp.]